MLRRLVVWNYYVGGWLQLSRNLALAVDVLLWCLLLLRENDGSTFVSSRLALIALKQDVLLICIRGRSTARKHRLILRLLLGCLLVRNLDLQVYLAINLLTPLRLRFLLNDFPWRLAFLLALVALH